MYLPLLGLAIKCLECGAKKQDMKSDGEASGISLKLQKMCNSAQLNEVRLTLENNF